MILIAIVALMTLFAAPAGAWNAPLIMRATSVGPESATLSGTVDTGPSTAGAPCYSFEYDTRSDWARRRDLVRFTTPVCLHPGTGVVTVTAKVGCLRGATCAADTRLLPRTRYQAMLFVQYAAALDASYAPTADSYAQQLNSPQRLFTTAKLGSVARRR